MDYELLVGDARDCLERVAPGSVRACVTSPPYFGLRDYGHDAQIGAEPTVSEYVAALVSVFGLVRRALAADGTLWLNLGDSYARSPGKGGTGTPNGRNTPEMGYAGTKPIPDGLKPKDLIGIPWRVAFALQADGWYLRSDIIWCLSGGAYVYARTQKGDMPVMVKDLVRLDPATVRLWNGATWTRVLGWGRSTDESERIELVLRSGERIGCTGGHLWPTQRGNVAARDLVAGDVIESCGLPDPEGAARPPYLTDDALWLLGLFLAEGSRSGDTLQLAMHADEMGWLPRIEAIAAHYGGSCSHTLDGNRLAVRLYGRVLNALVSTYVAAGIALTKHLKAAAWSLPASALRHLATGYLDGDGSLDAPNSRIRLGFCRNYYLERDLRTLAARLGATVTIRPCLTRGFGRDFPAFRGEWRWTRSGHRNQKPHTEVVETRASRARQFWDIAVEDEPHLFALSSGVLTHNCKPNAMPESVADRPTSAHEHVFLLAKQERYYYDAEAIAEPSTSEYGSGNGFEREGRLSNVGRGSNAPWEPRARGGASAFRGQVHPEPDAPANRDGRDMSEVGAAATRNARNVWTIPTRPFGEAHFATMPPELARRCILAGSRPGDLVLDPFAGAGTTLMAALQLDRRALGIELNPEYASIARDRLADLADQPRLLTLAAR